MGKLERAFPNELAVIGVQSPKYPAEADPENLRAAVQRYGTEHPVVDDPDLAVWDSYAVSAWPTLVFLSPRGEVIGRHAGEAPFEALAASVEELIARFERDGSLRRGPSPLEVAPSSRPLDRLSFPGKVLATAEGLFIADSGHHRLILCDPDGNVRSIVGEGVEGFADGEYGSARFNRPQGMSLDPDGAILYVADAENHAIRAVDLGERTVRTVAGTGEPARRLLRRGPALETALSSPWDLAFDRGRLFIAMAGLHAVWMLDPRAGTIEVWAGTGHEGIRDGPRESAWLAQPMGLSLHAEALYVACAESQAVRHIDMESGKVTTLVGQGLFDFGDEDGLATGALLQHPQALAAGGGVIYIADTYNNKIKSLDLASFQVRTYMGSGIRGALDGPGANARFAQPTGLSLLDTTLYIADTNNHLIRTADLDSGHVRTLDLQGLNP